MESKAGKTVNRLVAKKKMSTLKPKIPKNVTIVMVPGHTKASDQHMGMFAGSVENLITSLIIVVSRIILENGRLCK